MGRTLELASSVTDYGYTMDVAKPYYIFLRPFYDNGLWTDSWRELTECRAFKINTIAFPNITTIGGGLDGADDHYNRWYMRDYGDNDIGLVYDFTASALP